MINLVKMHNRHCISAACNWTPDCQLFHKNCNPYVVRQGNDCGANSCSISISSGFISSQFNAPSCQSSTHENNYEISHLSRIDPYQAPPRSEAGKFTHGTGILLISREFEKMYIFFFTFGSKP